MALNQRALWNVAIPLLIGLLLVSVGLIERRRRED